MIMVMASFKASLVASAVLTLFVSFRFLFSPLRLWPAETLLPKRFVRLLVASKLYSNTSFYIQTRILLRLSFKLISRVPFMLQ